MVNIGKIVRFNTLEILIQGLLFIDWFHSARNVNSKNSAKFQVLFEYIYYLFDNLSKKIS